MKVKELSCAYTLTGLPSAIREDIMDHFSTIDYNTEEKVRLGYLYDEEADILRIPKVKEDSLFKLLGKKCEIEKVKSMPHATFEVDFEMKKTPTDIQLEVLNVIEDQFDNEGRVLCDMIMGSGKTFTTIELIRRLGIKTLVFAQTNNLRTQWMKDMMKNSTIDKSDIILIEHASQFNETYPDKNIFICTHHNIRALMKTDSCNKDDIIALNVWLHNNGIGMKVYDEADLETSSLLKIDMITNIKHTLYLTGTTVKSSKHDNAVFQRATERICKIGSEFFEDHVFEREWIQLLFNSSPSRVLYSKAMKFNNEFSPFNYTDYLFMYKQRHLLKACDIVLKENKELLDEDKNNRLVIFLPKKAYCFILRDMLKARWGNKYTYGVVNSLVKKEFIEWNKSRQIIFTTIKSMGRGIDLDGIRIQLDIEVYTSEPQFRQQVFRTARLGGKSGKYYGLYDKSYSYIYRTLMIKENIVKRNKNTFKKIEKVYMNVSANPEEDITERDHANAVRKAFIKKWWKYLSKEEKYAKKNRNKS